MTRGHWITIGCFISLLGSSSAVAGRTVVLAVGSNEGVHRDLRLRYAERDAQRFAAAFSELGSNSPIVHLQLGRSASAVQSKLQQLRSVAASARPSLFVFYYSGHGDRDFMRLGGTRLSWSRLKSLVAGVGADLTISFVDACESGGVHKKGASRGKPFSLSWKRQPGAKGTAWIASSRAAEASYESVAVGGSYFSHYLVSGLRGAADRDHDQRITLAELYAFAFDHTVGRTSLTLRRAQHPTFRLDVKGEGPIVLTRINRSRTIVVFPRESAGSYYLAKRFGESPNVLEVAKKKGKLTRVAVEPGAYLLYRRGTKRIWLAPLKVKRGQEHVVDPLALKPRVYQDVVRKGGRVTLTSWSAAVGGAVVSPIVWETPVCFGVTGSLSWRDLSYGIYGRVGWSTFSFDAVDARIANHTARIGAGAELFWDLTRALLAVRLGLDGKLLWQQPEDASSATSFSPGLSLSGLAEVAIWGPIFAWAELGASLWIVKRDDGVAAAPRPEGSVGLGCRFR